MDLGGCWSCVSLPEIQSPRHQQRPALWGQWSQGCCVNSSVLVPHGWLTADYPAFPRSILDVQCVCVRVSVWAHAQLCQTLCDPMDCGPPGSSVHGILQARILEWVAISSSRGSSRPRFQTCISCISSIGRQVLYQLSRYGSPEVLIISRN